jgi:carbonic anhydrase
LPGSLHSSWLSEQIEDLRWRTRGAGFFRGTFTGAATAAFAGFTGRAISAQTSLIPEPALQQLIDGNRRFAEGRMTSFAEDFDILKTKTTERQEPFAAVLSCVDSRVPVELIFDQSIGHLFVARVAGNIATSAVIAGLEYGRCRPRH